MDRSFERLYAGHRQEVYRAALRALGNTDDAEDVTQAAFVDAYRAILRGSRPSAPRAWLLAIAENVRRRRFRTALRRPREEPLDAELAASAELTHEHAEAVRLALVALPPHQREVFLLREVSGLSYEEIAERTDSTTASVQMLLFRARRSLRAELDPPAVTQRRRSLGLQLPAWLAQLVGRGDTLALAPRGVGAVGAAVLAVTGVTAGAVHLRQPDDPHPRVVVREQPRLSVAVPLVPVRHTVAPSSTPAAGRPTRAPAAPARAQAQPPAPSPAPTQEAATPSPAAPDVVAPPADPPVQTPAPPVSVAPPAPVAVPPLTSALPAVPPLTSALPAVPPVALPVPPVVPPVLPELPELPELPRPAELPPVVEPLVPTLPLP